MEWLLERLWKISVMPCQHVVELLEGDAVEPEVGADRALVCRVIVGSRGRRRRLSHVDVHEGNPAAAPHPPHIGESLRTSTRSRLEHDVLPG